MRNTTAVALVVMFLLSGVRAAEIELVSVADSLAAPDAPGALVVSTGGAVSEATASPDALRAALGEYFQSAGFRIINLAPADLDEKHVATLQGLERSLPLVGPGRAPAVVEHQGERLAFVGAHTADQLQQTIQKLPDSAVAVLLVQHDPVEVAQWLRKHQAIKLALVGTRNNCNQRADSGRIGAVHGAGPGRHRAGSAHPADH